MLDSDMNVRYWSCLVVRYSRRDKYLKILLAITTSATVLSWSILDKIPNIVESFSIVSATIAIILPILDDQKNIEKMSSLAEKWVEMKIKSEDLWCQVESNSKLKKQNTAYVEFRKIEIKLQKWEVGLQNDKKLLEKCYNEVLKTRGLA